MQAELCIFCMNYNYMYSNLPARQVKCALSIIPGEPEAIREMEAIEQEKLDREGLFQNVFLFNITADPFERHDLSRVC